MVSVAARRKTRRHALLGDFLYNVGFSVEYAAVRLWRRVLDFWRWFARAMGALLVLIARPPVRAVAAFWATVTTSPLSLVAYLLPVVGMAGFVMLVRYGLALPFVLRVEVGGQVVGYVSSEQDFDAARADVLARVNTARTMLAADGQTVPEWDLEPSYTLAIGSADTPTMTEGEITNAILQTSGSEIVQGTAVYIDGTLQYITTAGDHLRSFLQTIKQPWEVYDDSSAHTDFVHTLRLVDGIYLAGSTVDYGTVVSALQANDSELLQVKVVKNETYTRPLAYETQTEESADLDFGETETVQTGVDGSEYVTYAVTYVNGEAVGSEVIDVQVNEAPVNEIIRKGTRLENGMVGKLGTGTFMWPVPEYRHISRWASLPYGHRGVDIAAPAGTPIYAADSGTVIAAQWHHHPLSWGYYVEIDHGNGYKTLYAHMLRYVVQAGDTVEKGQLIGYVGSTGYSTGNHCHFEMYYNDVLFSAREVFPDIKEWNN